LDAEDGRLPGIRDLLAVQSSLTQLRDLGSDCKCDDIAQLAAAYAYGIARNHGLADSNKGPAPAIVALFLMLNG